MTRRSPFKLDQLGSLARGKSRHRPRNDPSLYGGLWPFFQTGDVKEAELYLRNFTQTYNEVGLAQSKLWPVGTLCITIAANIAETAILGIPGCFPDSIVGFIPDPKKSDARFIKYFIETLKIGMQNASKGTTQDNLSVDKLMTFDFVVPNVEEQRRIASILSAYDDLIENNTRRIAILEEMARRIYEEWFVRFRFPGHETVPMVESELGLVPQGWRAATLGDVAAYINRGLAPKYDETATCIVINQKCIRDQRLSLGEARKQSKPVPTEKVVQLGDVLINSTGVGTLGRVAQVLEVIENCTVDTHVSIVRPSEDCDPDYFGLTLLAQQSHFEAQGVGSTGQTELSRGRIAETTLIVPPLALQRAFSALVGPVRRLAVTLQHKNQNLRTTRDLLLPKLISGELDVSALPEPETVAA